RAHSTPPYSWSNLWKKYHLHCRSHSSQLVIPAGGSTFTHWITSPRWRIVLTRDTTNHPIWCRLYSGRAV
ncbi:hypothetical protein PISMIDRAFT_103056, partial [Pisolithus microcarpus 441]